MDNENKAQKKGFISLWVVFVLLVLTKLSKQFSGGGLPGLEVMVWSAALSVFLLIKSGIPSKRGLTVSGVLTLLVVLSGLAGGCGALEMVLFTILTALSSLAVISVSEKTEDVKLIRAADKKSVLISVLIGAAVAVPLAVVNTLANTGGTMAPVFSVERIFRAVKPGISEDMAFRALFMAFCVYLTKNKMSKWQVFTMYVMMTLPHGLMHNMGILSCVMCSIIFGIPFSLLQRKRDITSAMVSHFAVDAVRFIIFGG